MRLHFAMGTYVDVNLRLTFSLCFLKFWRNFKKRAQIQSDYHRHDNQSILLVRTVPRCANGMRVAFKHKLTDF